MTEEESEKDELIQQLMQRNDDLETRDNKLNTALSSSAVDQRDGNLIQYQLDNTEMLEKLERFYRGQYIGVNKKGEQVWKSPEDTDLVPLNEFGVNSMMELVTRYIDRNTTLSYYSEERIYEILADLGDELTLFILCNYEKMGMDNYFKKTKFRMLILTTLHIVESTYRRAIRGNTSQEINQSKIVTQTDPLGYGNRMGMNVQTKKKFSFRDPSTWG